jgi:ABC-2 type transport system ATP-binding protein
MLALDLRNLVKCFGAVTAVNDLTLQVQAGEIVAFLGPNGAGKTTIIDMMLGLGRPTSGTVLVYGQSPAEAVARGEIATVMQTGGLLKDFTVRETVRYLASLYPHARPVDEVLSRAGIAGLASRLVGKCSGGEQQRLRFALALLSDPRLLMLDEPTTGMDVEGRREFWSAIREDATRGRTVLFATHYLDEADAYADRIVLIRQGAIVADGTTAEIKNLASGRRVRATLAVVDVTALRALAGVLMVEQRGDSVFVTCTDSDVVARYLLTHTVARDVEISSLALEIRRLLRNRRTVFFILIVPSLFFYLFGVDNHAVRAGGGVALAYVMVSMAVYGAMVGNTSGGASVAVERSLGWSRQLRLMPMHPLAYVLMKVLTAMTLGLIAIVSTFVVGALAGVHLPLSIWIASALAAWAASFVFAAFGLLVGFVFPAGNVMQFVGPLLAVMAMFGGLFIPMSQLPKSLQEFALFTPMYGVGQLARAPLVGGATIGAVASVVGWTLVFAAGAMVMFRRDTARV